jgi:outer membrane protein TolC
MTSIIAILGLSLSADAADLGYEQALEQALSRNPTLQVAGTAVQRADGALLAASAVFDTTLSASAASSSTVTQSSQLQGVNIDDRNSSFSTTLSHFFATGTTASLSWQNRQSTTLYLADNQAALDQLREFGLINEDIRYQSSLVATMRQSLLEGFRMSNNLQVVRTAQRARDQADAARLRTRQEVLAQTARAYWELWYQRRRVSIAEQGLEVAKEEQRIVTLKVQQGTLATVEQARVDAAVVQAESALLAARTGARNAANALLVIIGEAPGGEVTLSTDPTEPRDLTLDPDKVVEAALANNPELQSLRLASSNAELDMIDARHRRLPQLDVNGSFGLIGLDQAPASDTDVGIGSAAGKMFEGDARLWSVGADFTMPLGNRADRGSVDQAKADLRSTRLDVEARERTLAQEVRAQVDALQTASQQVDLANANLKLAEATLSAERALADAGRSVQKNVLDAIRAVDDARLNVEKAKADYLVAIIELERLKGSL